MNLHTRRKRTASGFLLALGFIMIIVMVITDDYMWAALVALALMLFAVISSIGHGSKR